MHKRTLAAVSAALALAMALGTPMGTALAKDASIRRIGGLNRYDTMAQAVLVGFSTSDWAVITTGDSFPDALAASSLAGAKECPLILTASAQLSSQARDRLQRLGVKNVYVVGGQNAVSAEAEAAIAGMGISVTRIEGADRVATSVEVMREVERAGARFSTVIVTSGKSFADGLSIGPWAYHSTSPIVLAQNDGLLSDEAVRAIKYYGKIKNVLIVGGGSAVSDGIKQQLGDQYSYKRLGGSDRYDTNLKVTDWEQDHGLSVDCAVVATGENFPDALTASTLCGKKESILVLSDGTYNRNMSQLANNGTDVKTCYILGGTDVISKAAEDRLDTVLNQQDFFERYDGKRFTEITVVIDKNYVSSSYKLEKYKLEAGEKGSFTIKLPAAEPGDYEANGWFFTSDDILVNNDTYWLYPDENGKITISYNDLSQLLSGTKQNGSKQTYDILDYVDDKGVLRLRMNWVGVTHS